MPEVKRLPNIGDLVMDPAGPVGYIVGFKGSQLFLKWIHPRGYIDDHNENGAWSYLQLKNFKIIHRAYLLPK